MKATLDDHIIADLVRQQYMLTQELTKLRETTQETRAEADLDRVQKAKAAAKGEEE